MHRALTLTLARNLGAPVAGTEHDVEASGVELTLAMMVLPPQHRAVFLEQAPERQLPFLEDLIASGA